MSLGGSPHAEIDPEEVYTMILKGKRLQQPNNCPDQLLVHNKVHVSFLIIIFLDTKSCCAVGGYSAKIVLAVSR